MWPFVPILAFAAANIVPSADEATQVQFLSVVLSYFVQLPIPLLVFLYIPPPFTTATIFDPSADMAIPLAAKLDPDCVHLLSSLSNQDVKDSPVK